MGGSEKRAGLGTLCVTYWETPVTHSPTGLILSRTGGATGANILAKSKKRRVQTIFNSDCLTGTFLPTSPDLIYRLNILSLFNHSGVSFISLGDLESFLFVF